MTCTRLTLVALVLTSGACLACTGAAPDPQVRRNTDSVASRPTVPPPATVTTRDTAMPHDTATTRAPSSPTDPWADARRRGVAFRAVGNEPGWMLEIVEGRQVTMLADYGEIRVTTPAPAPATETATGDRVYSIRTDAHRLDIRIAARGCQDGMSGFDFPATVTATLDGRSYRGCGRALR